MNTKRHQKGEKTSLFSIMQESHTTIVHKLALTPRAYLWCCIQSTSTSTSTSTHRAKWGTFLGEKMLAKQFFVIYFCRSRKFSNCSTDLCVLQFSCIYCCFLWQTHVFSPAMYCSIILHTYSILYF